MTPERIEQERKAFEWWISNPAPPVPIDPCQKQKDGRYAYDHIEFAWRAWRTRSAMTPAMRGEPCDVLIGFQKEVEK